MPRLYREAPLNGDLGRLGQRDLPRRAARDGARARSRSRPSGRDRAGRRRSSARLRRYMDELAGRAGRPRRHRGARAADRRAAGARAPGLAARALRRPGGRRRVLRVAPRRRLGPRVRHAAGRRRLRRRSSSATPRASRRSPSGGPSTGPRGTIGQAHESPSTDAERQIDTPRARLRDPHRGGPELVPRALPVHLVPDRLLPGRDPGQPRQRARSCSRPLSALLFFALDPAARARARGGRDPQRDPDRRHRPVAVRRDREDDARHDLAGRRVPGRGRRAAGDAGDRGRLRRRSASRRAARTTSGTR